MQVGPGTCLLPPPAVPRPILSNAGRLSGRGVAVEMVQHMVRARVWANDEEDSVFPQDKKLHL